MKNIIYAALLGCLLATSSCNDMLELDDKTQVTTNYLYSSPAGLKAAATALYSIDRESTKGDSKNLYIVTMCDFATDIMIQRAGTCNDLAKLKTLTPASANVNAFWEHHYGLIGKANEIIAAAEKMDLSNADVNRAYGEAKFFRARSYFELWKRFERLYLNTEPTTVDNLDREYKPSTTEEVFALITKDLDDAMCLDWELPSDNGTVEYGRVTKATVKHVRAQVAMWQDDWSKAISECEDIFAQSALYHLEDKTENVFNSADLKSPEVLWSYQFSQNLGGGGSGNPLEGHHAAINTTSRYDQIKPGCILTADCGGYGWGRVYPNTYLLSLYDKEKDSRYTELFIHDYYYNDPSYEKYGEKIPLKAKDSKYLERLHFASKKFFDKWTNVLAPDRKTSFKDLIIYRLAETYLMASEAYMRRDGGNSAKALEYYNATWHRAGNDIFKGPLDQETLLAEYARELNFEGVRWSLLKRLGILAERTKAHWGETMQENPYLNADNIDCRTYFVKGKHECWPIPQKQIDIMGEDNFPQTPCWQ